MGIHVAQVHPGELCSDMRSGRRAVRNTIMQGISLGLGSQAAEVTMTSQQLRLQTACTNIMRMWCNALICAVHNQG